VLGGFVSPDGDAWGRPVDVAVDSYGAARRRGRRRQCRLACHTYEYDAASRRFVTDGLGLATRDDVRDERIEIRPRDVGRRECRHRSDSVSDLKLHEEPGKWLVVQGRPETGVAARVALVTVRHEEPFAAGELR
jgi:hypothetical protein